MAYIDEKILRQQKAVQDEMQQIEGKEIVGCVKDGKVIIKGREICFERQEYLDSKIFMMMPKDTRPMTEEEIRGAYLLGNRPQYLFHSEATEISLVFNHTENPVLNSQIIKMADVASKLLEKAALNGRVFRKKNIERNEKTIATVELVSNGYDDGVFTLNFYISLENKLLLGNINCASKNMAVLRDIAMQIVETIEIKETV